MATLRTSTPSVTMPDLVRRFTLVPPLDLFDVEDCDDSGAREHIVDRVDESVDCVGSERDVA